MSNRKEQALKDFHGGYNCGQSVFIQFEDATGIEHDKGARLTTCLGGGFSRMGITCGALMGACLAMSAACGKKDPTETDKQEQVYVNIQEMMADFEKKFGDTVCPPLLGYDVRDEAQLAEAVETDAFHSVCPKYVEYAVELAERYL